MTKPIHQRTMEQAFKTSGSQSWRREHEARREGDVEPEERDAALAWLAHVETGRIGTA